MDILGVSSNIYILYSLDIMSWFITKWIIDYSLKLKLFNTSFDLKSEIDFSYALVFKSGWAKYVIIYGNYMILFDQCNNAI